MHLQITQSDSTYATMNFQLWFIIYFFFISTYKKKSIIFQTKLIATFTPTDHDSGYITKVKTAVSSDLLKRYQEEHIRYFLQESAALDPRMKLRNCITPQTWERLTQATTELMVSSNNKIWPVIKNSLKKILNSPFFHCGSCSFSMSSELEHEKKPQGIIQMYARYFIKQLYVTRFFFGFFVRNPR